jgi:acetyl esterase/lipase
MQLKNKLQYFVVTLSVLLSACAFQTISRFDDPTNIYNAQTTYQKLKGDYPFIRIASTTPSASVREIKNLTYVQYGNRALQLDLYLPKVARKKLTPAIVFVHGGGWKHGYRENFTPMAIRMAEQGYTAATVSYRLSPEAQYPAAIHDVKAAVRWLRTHAKKYSIDAQHIAIAGGSAGGQIASLVGVTNDDEKFDPQLKGSKISSAVQAIINIDGLSDFTTETALKFEDDPSKKPSAAGAWFGGRYAEKTELWEEASPINHVSKNTPPMLFIGSAQTRFSVGREEMIEKLTPLGVKTQLVLLPSTPHSFWMFDPWLEPTANAAVEFLNKEFNVTRAGY